MKKIVFVHLLNDYSGSPKVLSQVVKIAQKNGYLVDLYTGKSDDGFLSDIVKNHYFYFYKRFNNRYLTLISFFISQLDLFFRLLKYRNEDNVIFYVNTMLPIGAGIAGKAIGKDVYFHIHETSISPLIFKKFLRYVINKTANKIIFVSKYLKDRESFKEIKQEVVYNVLDRDFMLRALESNYHDKIIKDEFNILMICSLKRYKGVIEFIDIANSFDNIRGVNFYLILNATEREIELFFKNINLPNNIYIIPKQKDLHPFYKKANLVLNLSKPNEWVETFGLTILEAMAYGIPCIVPPVGGPTEIVDDNKNGYLLSSDNIQEIIHTIEKLMLDRESLLELSKSAREKSKKFNNEYFEKNILRILNEN